MKKILFLILLIGFASHMRGQSIDSLLQIVEQNNTILSALRKQAETDKIANQTGLYPDDPEIEYHYLWGNNPGMGNRTDFSASQSFDFPTSYYHRKKVAEGKNMQTDIRYQTERKSLLLEASQTCIQLVYQNLLAEELHKRLQFAQEIARAYQLRFDRGEINILDNNKAKLNLLNAQKESNRAETDQKQLLAELTRLNGGIELPFSGTAYDPVLLPSDFEQWYADLRTQHPVLQYMEQEIAIGKQHEKLQRSLNLPKLSVGYMSEKVTEEHFQGIILGVSIPLWKSKNTVKQIKAQTIASQAMEQDAQVSFYNQSKMLYEKALKMQSILEEYKENIRLVNNGELLKKALDKGEISIIEYIMELGLYYDTVNEILETERDLQLTVAELTRWEDR